MERPLAVLFLVAGLLGCRASTPAADPFSTYGSTRIPPPATGTIGSPDPYFQPGQPGPVPPAGSSSPLLGPRPSLGTTGSQSPTAQPTSAVAWAPERAEQPAPALLASTSADPLPTSSPLSLPPATSSPPASQALAVPGNGPSVAYNPHLTWQAPAGAISSGAGVGGAPVGPVPVGAVQRASYEPPPVTPGMIAPVAGYTPATALVAPAFGMPSIDASNLSAIPNVGASMTPLPSFAAAPVGNELGPTAGPSAPPLPSAPIYFAPLTTTPAPIRGFAPSAGLPGIVAPAASGGAATPEAQWTRRSPAAAGGFP